MDKIRLAIVDDHPIIREGVAELVSAWEDIELVATGASEHEALTIARVTLPDVMLLDYRLGNATSRQACSSITKTFPTIKVVVFTVYDDPMTVVEMVRAGAVGFVLKDAEAEHIHLAIKIAAEGDAPFDPKVTAALVQAATASSGSVQGDCDLDDKEKQLLAMVAAGLSNKEMSDRLYISEKTVKNNLTKLYKKLGVKGRAEAAAFGVRQGYHLIVEGR